MVLLKEQCILGIEGSNQAISIGIMDQGISKGAVYLNTGESSSILLLAQIDRLLKDLKLKKDKLEGVCVSLGPGGFTSLRVSIGTAKALGLGLNIPVYGVGTLELLAATVPFYPSIIRVIQCAYKKELYYASFINQNGKPLVQQTPQLIRPHEFYHRIEPNDLIVGNGIERLFKENLHPGEKKAFYCNGFHQQPSGISVLEHFLEKPAQSPNQVPLEPLYIRLPDAELNYSQIEENHL